MTDKPESEANPVHGIAEPLLPLAVPIEFLDELPGNPNIGDVDAVAASYLTFGQRKPLVAVPTRKFRRNAPKDRLTITAGNTQLRAARQLGWTHIAVLPTADDPKQAKAFAVADNRTAELGSQDDAALIAVLEDLRSEPALFAATAYEESELAALIRHLEAVNATELDPLGEWEGMPEISTEGKPPAFRTTVNFPSSEAAAEFFKLIDRPLSRSIWWPDDGGFVGSDVKVEEVQA